MMANDKKYKVAERGGSPRLSIRVTPTEEVRFQHQCLGAGSQCLAENPVYSAVTVAGLPLQCFTQ